MGLYPTNPTAEVEYLLQNSGARVLVVEDQEQVDKVLEVLAAELPLLERIVYIEQRGVDRYSDPRLVSWDDFLEEGRAHRAAHPGELERRMAAAEAGDLAYLIYTSGTTGPPKGAMLTVGNVDFAGQVVAEGGMIDPPSGPDDFILSYLPLCHVYEKLLGLWLPLYTGAVVNFAESIDTVMTDIREVQPTVFRPFPASGRGSMPASRSSWPRRRASRRSTPPSGCEWPSTSARPWCAREAGTPRQHGGLLLREPLPLPISQGTGRAAAAALRGVGRGADRARDPRVLHVARSAHPRGLRHDRELRDRHRNRPGRVRIGTVGEPQIRVEVQIDEETGEILTRHPGTFVGYWQMPEATARALDEDGWLHTGDVGEWVDGTHIRIVDRIKDIIITSGGKNISPSEIENSLKASPYIKEAIVIGDRRKYLTALIGIEFDVVERLGAAAQDRPHHLPRPLREAGGRRAGAEVVDETNAQFSSVEGIKKFPMLPKELDHENGELTATQKVKRSEIERKFGHLIEAMYR